jgi:hypothetical protein
MNAKLVQLGVNNSTGILSSNAQLPECFASDYALIRHLDQDTEKKQLSISLRRETLAYGAKLRSWRIPTPALLGQRFRQA